MRSLTVVAGEESTYQSAYFKSNKSFSSLLICHRRLALR